MQLFPCYRSHALLALRLSLRRWSPLALQITYDTLPLLFIASLGTTVHPSPAPPTLPPLPPISLVALLPPNRQCLCPLGRTGAICERPTCANGCSGHGFCKASGECSCESGWTGFDCSTLGCPASGCGAHGVCDAKRFACRCESGWTGAACSEQTCPGLPTPCSDRGLCVNGTCYCHPSASGPDCANPACPNECSQNGLCTSVSTTGFQRTPCCSYRCDAAA